MTEPRFSSDESGVITDSKTGKKWFVALASQSTWLDSSLAVAALTIDGGGWRIPTLGELGEIFETGKGTRNIDPLFEVTGTRFWAEEIDTDKAKIFTCCNRSSDWRYKIYSVNTNTLAVKNAA